MISVTVIALLANVVLLVVLTVLALRHRGKPGATAFAALQGLSAVWAALTVVGLLLSAGALRFRLWGLTTGTSLLVIVLWLAFILSYTGRSRWLSLRRFGPLAAPLVVGAGLYFAVPGWSAFPGQVTQESIAAGTVVTASIGPVGGALGVYVYLAFLAGIVLILKTVLSGPRLFVGQAVAIVLGSLVTIVASMLVIAGVPTEGYPLTQVVLGGQALLWGYAVLGQELLRVVPAVAEIGERAVFDEIDDGVLVVDTDGRVTRANPRAGAYLDAEEPAGEQVEDLLSPSDLSVPEDLPARFERDGRTYQVKASAVGNWRGDTVGHAVLVQDISRLVRRQQGLQVLNRILRHNVRNEMNVVMMVGDRLQESEDPVLVEMGETLSRRSGKLTTISEKALEINRVLDNPGESHQVDLDRLVEDVLCSLTNRCPDATVRTAVGADSVRTDSRILTLVLQEVVENALEHGGDSPTVEVTISETVDGVELAVSDDGPGIPEEEYAPIVNGGETALDHGSSLGLWLIHWSVQSLGGDLDIDSTRDGSTVTFRVPDLSSDEVAVPESFERVPARS